MNDKGIVQRSKFKVNNIKSCHSVIEPHEVGSLDIKTLNLAI
jgi:hypothetical protein